MQAYILGLVSEEKVVFRHLTGLEIGTKESKGDLAIRNCTWKDLEMTIMA